jgi:hypothetical protein
VPATPDGDVALAAVRHPSNRPVNLYLFDLTTGARTGGQGIASGIRPVRDIAVVTR